MGNTTDRYDPTPDAPNGHCLVCDAVFATQEDGDTHMSETLAASTDGRGHRIRRTNPSRKDRVRNAIESIIEDAVYDICSAVDDLWADDHITEEEATQALRQAHVDFEDAWEEYNQ